MTTSYTYSETEVFTVSHARYIASKVEADLKRVQRFYQTPNDYDIECFRDELIQLLNFGILQSIWYGFQRHNHWIEPTLVYEANECIDEVDEDP